MTITHLHSIPGGPNPAAGIDGSKTFPWVYARMLAGETLAYSNDDLPEEAEIDRESRISLGVKSSVNIPLQVGGDEIIGILTFDTFKRKKEWKKDDVKRLQLVADIFANTLVRKQAVEKLIESEERLSMAAESAEAGLWELDCKNNLFWATDQARRIFDFSLKETITMDRFERSVIFEDLETVKNGLAESFLNNAKLDIEYRIRTAEGSLKWICSRGRPYFDDAGSAVSMRGVSIDVSDRDHICHVLKLTKWKIEGPGCTAAILDIHPSTLRFRLKKLGIKRPS